eukprot:139204-Hanusia_phi.AAC.1
MTSQARPRTSSRSSCRHGPSPTSSLCSLSCRAGEPGQEAQERRDYRAPLDLLASQQLVERAAAAAGAAQEVRGARAIQESHQHGGGGKERDACERTRDLHADEPHQGPHRREVGEEGSEGGKKESKRRRGKGGDLIIRRCCGQWISMQTSYFNTTQHNLCTSPAFAHASAKPRARRMRRRSARLRKTRKMPIRTRP